MHQIQVQLTDQHCLQAQHRAIESGYETVDEYIADVIVDDLENAENLDHFFTSERLAIIDKAAAGQSLTADQVREHFKKRFEE